MNITVLKKILFYFFSKIQINVGNYIDKLLIQFVLLPQLNILKTMFTFSIVFEFWFWYLEIKYDLSNKKDARRT